MTPTGHVTPVCGTPCWVNLMTRNLRATQDFYSVVLGWEFRPGNLGTGFSVASAHGQPVAGLGEVAPGRPVAGSWTPYFAVADADVTAGRVRERGGTIAVGPVRFGLGRGAVAADRDGAVFGFWEGRALRWSDEHGNPPAFLELRTRDAFDAAIFYAQIFDWASGEPGGCEIAYAYENDIVTVRQAKNTVATVRGGGVGESPDPRVRPRWHVHFRVDDVEPVIAAAYAAGGTATPLAPSPGGGTESVISDPGGGLFTVSTRSVPAGPVTREGPVGHGGR
ncbi:VOC family protein [Streptomyces sp. AM2-3-1]|uniref:VOC family protein n=1 Tax=unclassified Streptomyces TaxID=2593676 RepID=UPI0028C401DC|nr:VOC family protein [Streptomyces sp. AM2-3-1]WNO68101.1 VOC family protein [Streptomyces sp. AM2-3-1]WTI90496.1 VOC family protein [Streptomyces sp. NBC_00724]